MKPFLWSLLFCILALSISAQDLLITNGSKTKSIKKDAFLELGLNDSRLNSRSECACMKITGTLLDHTKDSITVQLISFEASFDKLEIKPTSNIDFSRGDVQQRYAVSDIITLRKYKSPKHVNHKFSMSVFGALFISTGILTAIQFPLAGNSRGRKNLLLSGGIQLAAGVTLVSFSGKRTFRFKKLGTRTQDIWRVE